MRRSTGFSSIKRGALGSDGVIDRDLRQMVISE